MFINMNGCLKGCIYTFSLMVIESVKKKQGIDFVQVVRSETAERFTQHAYNDQLASGVVVSPL